MSWQLVGNIAGRAGRDGREVDIDAIASKAAALIPPPKDGKSLTAEDIAPLVRSELQKAMTDIPPPKDGVGVAGAVIDRDGRLILTLSNGATQELGAVVGRNGTDYDPAVAKAWIVEEVAKIPRPKDGSDGAPGDKGADGLGFDNLDLTFDETKGYALVVTSGERSKEFRVPVPWFAGVWQPGRAYPKGAIVLHKGDQWTAKADGPTRPGDSPGEWQLSVRRGRDGKDLRSAD